MPRNQAFQYGLKEKDIPVGARVCNSCRCKSVRSRCMVCPIPTCPNGKTAVKRLRTIAWERWDYVQTILESMLRELRKFDAHTFNPLTIFVVFTEITTATLKCCSACYSRICRRLGPANKTEDSRPWTEADVDKFKMALSQHGTNWAKISELFSDRTHYQCKTFYSAHKKVYRLDEIVQEYIRVSLSRAIDFWY